jgi:nicotinamide-nucleotide adenylyltransferase
VVLDSSFNPPSAAHLSMATDAVLAELKSDQTREVGRVRLLLLLAVKNADKAAKPAAFEQRLAMMWAFAKDVRRTLEESSGQEDTSGNDGVAIDVALSTQPFFHEKSAAIADSEFYKPSHHEEGGKAPGKVREPEQVILAGYDTLIRILHPKYYGSPSESSDASSAGETPIRKALDPFFKRARLRVTLRTDAEWGGKDEQTSYVEKLLHGGELEKIGGSKEWAKRIEIVESRKEGEAVVSSTLAREAAKAQDWSRLEGLVSPEVKKWIEREKLYTDA